MGVPVRSQYQPPDRGFSPPEDGGRMAKTPSMARIRPKKSKTKQKNFGTSWPVVKQAYVTSEQGLREIADRYGLPFRTVAERSRTEDWVQARREYQEDLATELQREMKEDTVTYRLRAAKAIRAVKEQALHNLLKRVERGIVLDVKDLDILQRLEMDLREPGWTKSEAEQRSGGVTNVLVGLDSTVLESLNERGLLETTGSSRVKPAEADDLSENRPDGEVTGFLYDSQGGEGEEVPELEA